MTITNEAPATALPTVLGRSERATSRRILRVAVTRGCDDPTLLWSGRLDALSAAPRPGAAPAGRARAATGSRSRSRARTRRCRAAGPCTSSRSARRTRERAPSGPPPEVPPQAPAGTERGLDHSLPDHLARPSRPPARRRNPVLIKYHRIRGRILAKLIVRIYGAPGRQRLVLVTGLRIGRHEGADGPPVGPRHVPRREAARA